MLTKSQLAAAECAVQANTDPCKSAYQARVCSVHPLARLDLFLGGWVVRAGGDVLSEPVLTQTEAWRDAWVEMSR